MATGTVVQRSGMRGRGRAELSRLAASELARSREGSVTSTPRSPAGCSAPRAARRAGAAVHERSPAAATRASAAACGSTRALSDRAGAGSATRLSTAQGDGDRRAQRPLRRPAGGPGQGARDPDAGAPAGEPDADIAVFVHGLGETEYAWGSPHYGDRLERLGSAGVRPLQHGPPYLGEWCVAGRIARELVASGRWRSADRTDRAFDGRAGRSQRVPSRRRRGRSTSRHVSRWARRIWAPRSSRPCTR